MEENIKLIDLVIELVDARVPLASRNPDIDALGKNKSRLVLLNKSDLADEHANKLWKEYFWSQSFCLLTTGGAPIEIIEEYIETQGQKDLKTR